MEYLQRGVIVFDSDKYPKLAGFELVEEIKLNTPKGKLIRFVLRKNGSVIGEKKTRLPFSNKVEVANTIIRRSESGKR